MWSAGSIQAASAISAWKAVESVLPGYGAGFVALALLFFEDPTPDDSLINPFFHSMLGSITRACAVRGYDLLVSFQQLSNDWQADYEDSKKADGIILLGYGDHLAALPPAI